jgi:2',3'-cyclic-nucleotide 2'-phosphodiesterase / 3'-nucleotidase
MKPIIFIIIVFTFTVIAQNEQHLIILQTTDVHGNIYPYNYFSDEPADVGLAKVYTKVKEFRKKKKNVLLLDSGDLLQGTPLIYYFNNIESTIYNPMILVMNYMQYEAFTVGNHDIEQGYLTYYKAMKESDFPWLSANGIREDGSPFFKPYTIIEKNGIKIGIIGLTTPAIPMWLDESLYPGIEWKDMVITAEKNAKLLRPKVDVLIGSFHAGMNEDYSKEYTESRNLPNENASKLVAEKVPEFDIIFSGHSHKIFPKDGENCIINNTAMVLAGSHGKYLGVGDIILDNNKVVKKEGYVINLKEVEPAKEILYIAKPYHDKTLSYIREQIGISKDTISAKNARWQDTALIELINKAQINKANADISFAASFNENVLIKPGPVLVKDVYGMYIYENFLYLIEMTGQQILDYLEFSAQYYLYDENTKKITANPKILGFNYDMAEGISYTIDVTKEIGKRIKDVIFLKTGENLNKNKIYKVALNSYRASGGGGHLAAAGIQKSNILWKSNEEMRNILADYIKEIGEIGGKVDNNWRLIK